MIMSPLAKLEMAPCKGAIIVPLKGGRYGRGGHYHDEQKGIKTVTCNSKGIREKAKAKGSSRYFRIKEASDDKDSKAGAERWRYWDNT